MDDGSTDSSVEQAASVAAGDPRFTFLSTTPALRGANAARNIGWKAARYQWVLFLDSDDLLSPECISNRAKVAEEVVCDLLVFPISTFLSSPGDRSVDWRPRREDPHLLLFLRHRLPWHTSSVLWRRSLLEKLGGFSERLARLQDVEIHIRALLAGASYGVIENSPADCFYRVSEQRATFSPFLICKKYVDSCRILSQDTIDAIKKLPDVDMRLKRSYLRALRGTTFAVLFRLVQEADRGHLTWQQRSALSEQISKADYVESIFGKHRITLRVYNLALALRLGRLKGFMRVTRAFLT